MNRSRILFFLGSALVALAALSRPSLAGPNAGGVLLLHAEDGIVYCQDVTDYCGQSSLTVCQDATTSVPADSSIITVFFVLAAFPNGASPRLSALSFGVSYDPEALVLRDHGSCADFDLASQAWPEPGTGVALTWDEAQQTRLVETYWFAAYAYSATHPTSFVLTEHPTQGGMFGDDAVPSRIDAIESFGALGFGEDGVLPCPEGGTGQDAQGPPRWFDEEQDAPWLDDCVPGYLTIRFFPGVVSFEGESSLSGTPGRHPFSTARITDATTDSVFAALGATTMIEIGGSWRSVSEEAFTDELGNPIQPVSFEDVYGVWFDPPLGARDLLSALIAAPAVATASGDLPPETLAGPPDDPYYVDHEQWGLDNPELPSPLIIHGIECVPDIDVNMPEGWLLQAEPGTKVAILENAAFTSAHPDIAGQFDLDLSRYTGTDTTGGVVPWDGAIAASHPSWVAGIAGAVSDNAEGVAGVMLEGSTESLVALRLRRGGITDPITPGFVNALDYVSNTIHASTRVANMSWGETWCARAFAYNGFWRDALRNAYLGGTSLVAAGGNGTIGAAGCTTECGQADECYAFPAAYEDYVLAVAGVRCDGALMSNDEHTDGHYLDLAAPGEAIVGVGTPVPPGGYQYLTGTSASAPAVSGICSLMLRSNPDLTNEDIYNILEISAVNPMNHAPIYVGRGIVRADSALGMVAPDVHLEHATATTYDCPVQLAGTMNVELSNIPGLTPLADSWYPYRVECYRLRTNVTLDIPAASELLGVWGRGKTSTGWRRMDQYFNRRYDGLFWGNYVAVTASDGFKHVTLDSFTYKVFDATGTSFLGWYPFEPCAQSDYVATYSFLWRPLASASAGDAPAEVMAGPTDLKVTPSIVRSSTDVTIEFSAAAGAGYDVHVVDVSGRRAADIVSFTSSTAGERKLDWAPSSRSESRLRSGVYWIVLRRGDQETRRHRIVVIN